MKQKKTDKRTFFFEDRPSNSPYVARVWKCYSREGGPFVSIAAHHSMFVVTNLNNRMKIEYRGPETKPTQAICPPNGEWLGIQLNFGVYMPQYSGPKLVDNEIVFPSTGNKKFKLNCFTLDFPDFGNAEKFISKLIKNDWLVQDPLIKEVVNGEPQSLSIRSQQRRFLQVAGLSRQAAKQIERARIATEQLCAGENVFDVIANSGYSDQPHLIRSLRRFVGLTPSTLRHQTGQLSYLFNTKILS